ncbi:MAG: neuraminidase-like domain-containing protein, partial [Longimicrobiales bacterium]
MFDGDHPVALAQRVVWQVTSQVTRLQIPLSAATPAEPQAKPAPLVVRGTIRRADGTPVIAGIVVHAFDRTLSRTGFTDTEIGSARTAADGQYEIRYTMPADGKVKPDLIVRAQIGPAAQPTQLESPLITNAPATAHVDLGPGEGAAPRLSEYRQIVAQLTPILQRGGVALADLANEHADFAATTAGIVVDRVRLVRQALRLERDAAAAVPAEIFYGLLRMGFQGTLVELPGEPLDVQRTRLEDAIARNIIARSFEASLDAILTALQQLMVAGAMPGAAKSAGGRTVAAVLATALSGTDIQREFLARWLARTGTVRAFWADLHQDRAFAGAAASDLEFTFRLAALFDSHVPALREVRRRRLAGTVTSLRDLARMSEADWQDFVTRIGGVPGTPPGTAPPPEAIQAYIDAIRAKLHRSHPTEALRAAARRPRDPLTVRWVPALLAANPGLNPKEALPDEVAWGDIKEADRASASAEWTAFRREALTFRHVPVRTLLAAAQSGGRNPVREAASRVLNDASDLDLESEHVETYLARKPAVLAAVDPPVRAAVIDHLKATQRVLRLVAEPAAVEPLLADGLDSAFRIVRVPPARFTARYAKLFGGVEAARLIRTRALRTAVTAQLALTTTAQTVLDVSPWAVRGGSTKIYPTRDYRLVVELVTDRVQPRGAEPGSASWPEIFGETTWCACTECQSVFSPAAYFVDLLHMLDQGLEKNNPLTFLFKRRPDLPYLKLSCENTNTTLPYIDLVNEVLETFIAVHHIPNDSLPAASSYDTGTLTADELRAVPQNVHEPVYARLAQQVYPFALPFHRPLAVVRAYLDQLGARYEDLLETLGPADPDGDLSADERLAAETLGLSSFAFKLIADATPEVTLPEAYGFASGDTQWAATIAGVPDLLSRTGIHYEELVDLVKTFFVNPVQHDPARRVKLEPAIDCKIEGTRVLGATLDTWSRIHRFIRLWRASGWSIADLDRALFAVANPSPTGPVLDRDALTRLAQVKRVQRELDRPLTDLLSLWRDLDTWGDDALYLARFQSRTVTRADDAEMFSLHYVDPSDADVKAAGGSFELTNSTELLATHVPTILAALRITESDLDLIWNHAIGAQAIAGRENALLSLHNLSVLHRYTVLAKGLDMRIADLTALLALTGADPFTARRPESTLAFVDLARAVQNSGMTVATLDYIYRHTINPAQGPAPADSEVLAALMKVWTALRAVRQDTEVTGEADATLLSTRLAMVHPPDVVASILDALDPAKGLDKTRRDQVLTDSLGIYLGSDLQRLLAADPVPGPDDDADVLFAQRRLDNQKLVLDDLSAWLRDSLSRSAVVSAVSSTIGQSDAMTRRLLVDWISGAGHSALDIFLGLAGGGLTTTYFDATGNPTAAGPTMPKLTITRRTKRRGARWQGRLLPLGDGPHLLVLRTDGAVEIQVDGQPIPLGPPVLDGSGRPALSDRIATILLTAGTFANLRIDYKAGPSAGSFDLLWKLESSPNAVPVPAENLFPLTAPAALDAPTGGPGFTWRRLHKAALLISGLGLTEEEIDWAESISGGNIFAGFHIGRLPMNSEANSGLLHMKRWRRLAYFAAVRASLPKTETTLDSVLRASSPSLPVPPPGDEAAFYVEHWAARLCDATGWDMAVVQPLLHFAPQHPPNWTATGAAILARLLAPVTGPVNADDLQIGRRLAMLARILTLGRRVGVAAMPTLRRWARREPTAAVAREVVQAVRARYTDDADWFEVARTRNDALREAQRNAMVSYLLPRMKIDGRPPIDANELFEYFLIDVETASCAATSRIKQAISSVQLYVQRCLLGLEKPEVSSDVIDAETWPWIKNYRVWEANRKIFLYPENWIEPELRDGKSPFFEDLESELKQAPLDDVHVEDAFLAYLDKLDQVARLDICAVHWQEAEDSDDIDVLHVIGRTPGSPAVFFYRNLINTSEWTPWEKLDLDIETEAGTGNVHMILTTHNRRLYLFWAVFLEKPEEEQPGGTEGDSPPPPLTHWEIRLAWSTYRDGRWSAKQVSTRAIISDRFIREGQEKLYKDAVRDFEKEVQDLEKAVSKAKFVVKDKEGTLWNRLQRIRDQLEDRIASSVDYWMDVLKNAEYD